jgi:hypothetical protein
MYFDSYSNPAIPAFEAAKRTAANIPAPDESGNYTVEMFVADFPESCKKTVTPGEDGEADTVTYTLLVPQATVERYVNTANKSVLPSRWGESWRDAVGLYVAHLTALRLQTFADGSISAGAAASNSQNVGMVGRAQMGDTMISYDNGAITAGTEKWGTWNSTKYGAQLVTMARMIGIAGTLVI